MEIFIAFSAGVPMRIMADAEHLSSTLMPDATRRSDMAKKELGSMALT